MDTSHDLRFDHGDETPPQLKKQFSRLIGMTAVQTGRVASEALRAVGAHKDHFVVLAALTEFGPASQADLSRRTRIFKSDLVAVLNDLEAHHLVRRAPDPADKRRNVITVTPAGHRRLTELTAILDAVNDQVLAPLSAAERTQLFALLGRVNAHLAEPDD